MVSSYATCSKCDGLIWGSRGLTYDVYCQCKPEPEPEIEYKYANIKLDPSLLNQIGKSIDEYIELKNSIKTIAMKLEDIQKILEELKNKKMKSFFFMVKNA
jgi:hypothetical protein